jgi:hypothetical protein
MQIYPVLEIDLNENQMAYVNLIEIYTSLDDAENHVGSNFNSFKEIDDEEFNKLANKWNLSIISQCKVYSVVCNDRQFYWAIITCNQNDETGWNISTNM